MLYTVGRKAFALSSHARRSGNRRSCDETRLVEVFAPGDSLADTEWAGHVRLVIRVDRAVLTRSAATGLYHRPAPAQLGRV